MTLNLPSTPPCLAAISIIQKLQNDGFQALLAGGCVRDLLLNRTPHDFDVATSAPPHVILHSFPNTVHVGLQFGVVIVVQNGIQTQVATFRSDGSYLDGRHPSTVHFSDPQSDALRRDFTINGLFYDPIAHKLLDFVGGQHDLKNKIIRTIGNPNLRFAEDHLRLLRAIRFASTLDFNIEISTWNAIRSSTHLIHSVSPERIRDELQKMLLSHNRVQALDLLDQSSLLNAILPEVTALHNVPQPPDFHPEGDVFTHTRLTLHHLPPDAPLPLVLSALFHDIGKPQTLSIDNTGRIRFNHHEQIGAQIAESILRRLRFPNPIIEQVSEAVRYHMSFKDTPHMRIAKLRRFLARPNFLMELQLHRADCLASHKNLQIYDFLVQKIQEFANQPPNPKPLINGHDLISLGLKPGPLFKHILEEVHNLHLEGKLTSREEALQWVKNNQTGLAKN